MRIGYFTNQYPAVSHTFIRREIKAIESLGDTVVRYALRPGPNLVDPEDKIEEIKTHHVVKSFGVLVCGFFSFFLRHPLLITRLIAQAIKIGRHSDRGILRNLAYVAEGAALASRCQRDNVQHLHAHFGTNSAAIAMNASQLSGIPYSFTAHGPDEFERAPWLSLDVKLDRAKFAVCVSSFGRSQLMRWCPSDQWPKIALVHCGLDGQYFDRPIKPVPAARRLVCVGRLSEQKGQLLLVAAAQRLRDEGAQCEIVLAGDGPMRSHIENAIREAGLQSKITITGWISNDRVREEIAAARALVLPSFAENMPVVIMESFALNRPVISTYIAGIPELVQPNRSGWLVPAGDEIALAKAMHEVLDASVDELTAMGTAGRRHVTEEHDSVKEAVKLKNLFEEKLSAHFEPNKLHACASRVTRFCG